MSISLKIVIESPLGISCSPCRLSIPSLIRVVRMSDISAAKSFNPSLDNSNEIVSSQIDNSISAKSLSGQIGSSSSSIIGSSILEVKSSANLSKSEGITGIVTLPLLKSSSPPSGTITLWILNSASNANSSCICLLHSLILYFVTSSKRLVETQVLCVFKHIGFPSSSSIWCLQSNGF